MSFGRRLEKMLADKKLTQAFVAKKSGLDAGHISHYVCDRREPMVSNLAKLLEVVCDTPEETHWLILGDQ